MRKLAVASLTLLAATLVAYLPGRSASAQQPKAPAPPAAKPACAKTFGSASCCDPAIAAHLTKEAIFSACGESEATYLGEAGSKETCKYFFKVAGEKDQDMYVQVYAPVQKEVPDKPTDPFFSWKKVGKAFVTDKAKTPKAAPMIANSTGIWLPGKGYFVSVNAATKVCSRSEASRLAASVK